MCKDPLRGSGNKNVPRAVSTLITRSWILNIYCFPLKRTKGPDSRAGQGKHKISLEHHLVPECKKMLKDFFLQGTAHVRKDRNQPEGALTGKSETIWSSTHITVVTDYNPLNTIGNHESIQTQIW